MNWREGMMSLRSHPACLMTCDRLCKKEDLLQSAKMHMEESYLLYRDWNSVAKLKSLQKEFPEYLSDIQYRADYEPLNFDEVSRCRSSKKCY